MNSVRGRRGSVFFTATHQDREKEITWNRRKIEIIIEHKSILIYFTIYIMLDVEYSWSEVNG